MALLKYELNRDWRFILGHPPGAEKIDFNDADWCQVDLPHDWSIEGEFNPHASSYCRGAWLPTGAGSYRKHLDLPKNLEGQRVCIYFGGAYRNARIFCNGHLVAFRPWGYISFEVDITDYIRPGESNVLAVLLDNTSQPGSRWYTGSGLYRTVSLYIRDSIYIPTWGTSVVVPELSPDSALLRIKTNFKNHSSERTEIKSVTTVFDVQQCEVARTEKTHVIGAGLRVCMEWGMPVKNPLLWDIDSPNLYTLRQELFRGGKKTDTIETRFGIRQFEYTANQGLFLNGRNIKVKGVCLHNDGGALGAACNKRTFERQIQILKDMGCNAVRTAHHPFSDDFLDVCDELGMLVLAEAFDEWQEAISVAPRSDGEPQMLNVDYYASLFDEWSIKDLTDMILRDRNHPSIFMWSIGNEVPQMHKASGRTIAEKLRETICNLDERPVTCAVTTGKIWSNTTDHNANALDVAGYNYPTRAFLEKQRQQFPDRLMIITEHSSAQYLVPRGTYYAKGAGPELPYRHNNSIKAILATETMKHGINAWEMAEANPFVMGSFIWTGWDYLGEITPYDWPAHTSFCGIIDRCGFPKDGYYYYKSRWQNQPVVHLRTHWNWAKGTIVAVKAITNCHAVLLSLNGRSLGLQKADDELTWDVEFEPGELKAVGLLGDKHVAECIVQTSGNPSELKLTEYGADKIHYQPGDLAYITCEVLDAKSLPVLISNELIRFEVEGPARIRALDNGDPFDQTPFSKITERNAFNGKCLAILEMQQGKGAVAIKASAPGLAPCSLVVSPTFYV